MAFNYAKRTEHLTLRSRRMRRCSLRSTRPRRCPQLLPARQAHWAGRVSAPGTCDARPRCPGDLNAGIWILAPAGARAPSPLL